MLNTFQAIKQFDRLDHAAVLARVAESSLAHFTDALVALQDQGVEVMRPEGVTTKTWQREVIELCLAGNKIAAIKLTRISSLLGLKESKDIVDYFDGAVYPSVLNAESLAVIETFKAQGFIPAKVVKAQIPSYVWVVTAEFDEDNFEFAGSKPRTVVLGVTATSTLAESLIENCTGKRCYRNVVASEQSYSA